MDLVFKALADAGRRTVLDRLYAADGQTLSELCVNVPYSRQALSKHLARLAEAGLVVSHFAGREKYHYLNPLPIQDIASRWLQKFDARQLTAVAALKQSLEYSDGHDDDKHTNAETAIHLRNLHSGAGR